HLSGSGGHFSWGAGALPERSDENARGAGNTAGAGPGSAGSDAGSESSEADSSDTGLPESHGNIDAAGVAAQIAGIGRAAPSARGRGSYLCAAAYAGRTHPILEATGPFESGDSHRQFRESGISGPARGMDCCTTGGHRAAARGEADHRSAHGSAGASNVGRVLTPRAFA